MIRRFNFTDRKRLPKSCAHFQMYVSGGQIPTEFQAEIDLEDQKLPAHAKVYVEAYYRSSLMRFPYGTVADCKTYADSRFKLTEILNSIAFFRVKVVDESEQIGRIIASIDRIKATTPGQQAAKEMGMLYVQYKNLGDQVWRLDVDDGHAMPILQVNNNLGESVSIPHLLTNDPMFFSLVYPVVVKGVLEYIVLPEDLDLEAADWKRRWLSFAFLLLGERRLPSELASYDEKQEWVEDVVQAFCAKQAVKARFEQALQERN